MRKFKYNRSDFGPLPVALRHMDLYINFGDDGRVRVSNTLHIRPRRDLDEITLDAKSLAVHSVEWVDSATGNASALDNSYDPIEAKLRVFLPNTIPEGADFIIRTDTTCVPTDNLLEGIYKDTTPEGCPQTYMSQCQQWGFQRIAPVFDDCTAKCTMTTTIEASAGYGRLISNGNVCRQNNPDGKPVPKPNNPDRKVITYRNDIPMAPYLFIVCAGNWDCLEDEVIYPSGRKVKLEYLVPPGRVKGAVEPMRILKEGILWLNEDGGYEYDREVYRTICMEKSNFGGMENVGNTTIITEAALIDEYTSDRRLQYAHGVIVHEFEHSQCGSDVTMRTPFDMWLNEAFTVDVERRFLMSRFDPCVERLDQVDSMRAPLGGPLAIEDSGHADPIVRPGFNDPDELVDGLTYVKAAEVIRMLRLIIGPEDFRKATDLYFSRFSGGNADTDDFFQCFEEITGRRFDQFKREWLHATGYPAVTANYSYDGGKKELRVLLEQSHSGSGGDFHLPFRLAAVDSSGTDIASTSVTLELCSNRSEHVFKNVPEPAFISFNRDCSFYGTFEDRSADSGKLSLQARLDSNMFSRVEAMRRLTDIERIALINDPDHAISPEWLKIWGSHLVDGAIQPGSKAYLLSISEQTVDRKYLPRHRQRYRAREALLKAVAKSFKKELIQAFEAVDTYKPFEDPAEGIEERMLKSVLLRTLTAADTLDVHKLAEDHFHNARHISDRVSALSCINISSHPRRKELLDEAYTEWKDILAAYASYLSVVSGGIHDDTFDMIAREEGRHTFKMTHPGHTRSLFLRMAANNRMLWTQRGIQWIRDTVIRLAKINENTAVRLISCFQLVDKLDEDLREPVLEALLGIRKNIDWKACPSLAGRLDAYIGAAQAGRLE